MTEKELMLSQKLYIAKDKELSTLHQNAINLLSKFNNSLDSNFRHCILLQLLGKFGKNSYIEPPLRMDYGINTFIGDNFYSNFDLIILDVAQVTIGNNVFIGPRVSIYTAGHPISQTIRNRQLEYGKEVKIGNDVWIGGNTVINPGVTIGDNVVIGSGSVVTKNIPSGVIAVGNPCKVLRPITLEDEKYWAQEADYYDEVRGNKR